MKKIISIGNYANVSTFVGSGCIEVKTGISPSDNEVVVYVEDGVLYVEANKQIVHAATQFKVQVIDK